MRKLILLLILFGLSLQVFARPDTLGIQTRRGYNPVFTFHYNVGTMIRNGGELGEQIAEKARYRGIDFQLGFTNKDYTDPYNVIYLIPTMGVGFNVSTFHEPAIGDPFALYYFFEIPLQPEQNKRISISVKGAFGISFNFNPFDSVNNPNAVLIGSRQNCFVGLGLGAKYQVNPRWQLVAGAEFRHFSNGSIKQPNFGINVMQASLGIAYKPFGINAQISKKIIPEFVKYNQFNFAFMAGSKNYSAGEPNYLKTGISINWLRSFSYKFRAGIGFDMFFASQTGSRNEIKSTFSNSFSSGVTGSGEWVLNRHVYIPIALGIYINRNTINDEKNGFYERIGMRYRFNNNMFAGITIKAHKGKADFFEWTLGYTLQHDPNRY